MSERVSVFFRDSAVSELFALIRLSRESFIPVERIRRYPFDREIGGPLELFWS
jgi:hypothetical protein